jgi:DNA mismatch repair protein MSH6
LDDKDSEILDELLLKFTEHYRPWLEIIKNLSQLDILLSFAVTIDGANGPMCRPSFVPTSTNPKGGAIIDVQELWHPFASSNHGGAIVRNNITLGSESNSCRAMLLTGPNMGGKSTLLRATCMLVILAQVKQPSCLKTLWCALTI